MADWMLLVGAAAAAVAGCAWLALAMQVHWEQVYGYPELATTTQAALRLFGVTGLAVSAVLCFMADRPSMAALLWIMLMVFGACLVAFALAWRPALLKLVWPASSARHT